MRKRVRRRGRQFEPILNDFFQRAFGSILVQDGRVDPPYTPLHADCTVHLIQSVVVVAFAGMRDRNKRDDRTQNVLHIENESIDVDASGTKELDVLEGT